MTLQTVYDGALVKIAFPDDTAEAARQADLAQVSADAAALSAQAALAASRYYSTLAAGVAATTAGQMFTSDEGGTWSYYLRTGTSPFYTLFRGVLAADVSGNLGIGGSASEKLDVYGCVQARAQKAFNGVGFQPYLGLVDSNAAFAEVRLINAGGAAYILTGGALRWKWETAGHQLPEADNAYNLGSGARRVATYYGATGTINTSDSREKTWRGAMTAAELAAAKRIVAELGFYQWNDAIAEKGPDGARYHFGGRAQQVAAIMIDEGVEDDQDIDLPPDQFITDPPSFKTAFLCFDTWEATDDAPAGNRFGLRIDQLILFLIAAQEQRLAALEAAAA